MDLLEGLNGCQKQAVVHTQGPLLILAGAGSGKTRVLTHRIAYLIKEKHVHPGNIIAITFTNKAAKEMKNRVENMVGEESKDIWLSTFHSACVRILRIDIDKIGYNRNFIIFDESDQHSAITDCLKELNMDEKFFHPKMVTEVISNAKSELITAERFSNINASDYRLSQIAKIYELYQKKLRSNNALDFDDIIMCTVELLNKNKDVLEYYQNKFKYVLVDEYQDTNTSQYNFISLLSRKHKNICVVGDDDQSIYGWRGANILNILNFEKEFTGCKVIKLEQNYRSSGNILNAANSVISNNYSRKDKKLWTDSEEGRKINWYNAENEYDEAFYICKQIKQLSEQQGVNYCKFAVLYRMNAQSRVIEDMFMKQGIPYKIVGGQKFYSRKEIKDIIAYLRIIYNPDEDYSLKRIINVPKRSIGEATIANIEQCAGQMGISMYEAIRRDDSIVETKTKSKTIEFVQLIEQFRELAQKQSVSQLIKHVLDKTGYIKQLEQEKLQNSQNRIENLKEFISVAMEFESESENITLEAFLTHISLITDLDTFEDEANAVTMMTLHSAKGLEFPIVFMVGMEEGIFPTYRSIVGSDKEIEEERRLCYVGITRAKEMLYIVNAESRTLFGNTSYNRLSRFVEEIPCELIETANHKHLFGNMTADSYGLQAEIAEPEELKVGDTVEHRKFGVGTVSSIEEEGGDYKIDIKFEQFGVKRLIAAYAKLKKIG